MRIKKNSCKISSTNEHENLLTINFLNFDYPTRIEKHHMIIDKLNLLKIYFSLELPGVPVHLVKTAFLWYQMNSQILARHITYAR